MRSKDLQKKRDVAIVEKFFELYEVKRMRMDDALRIMSEDIFFLDVKYLYARIFYKKENQALLSSLQEKKHSTQLKLPL